MTSDPTTPLLIGAFSVAGGVLLAPLFSLIRDRMTATDKANASRIAAVEAENQKIREENVEIRKDLDELHDENKQITIKVTTLSVELKYVRADRDTLIARNQELVAENATLRAELNLKTGEAARLHESNAELLLEHEIVSKDRDSKTALATRLADEMATLRSTNEALVREQWELKVMLGKLPLPPTPPDPRGGVTVEEVPGAASVIIETTNETPAI